MKNELKRKIFIFPWTARKADVAISRRFFPTRVQNDIPVVYHSGFPPNRYVGADRLEDRREGARTAARFYQENTEATIFSTQEAVDRFRRIVPKRICDKIVYLPYFLPNVEPVGLDHVDRTFLNADPVRMLFVGEDGKRKGVHEFLEAVEIAADRYSDLRRQIEVTVVSRTDIGQHNFPVEHHRFLPHKRVLEEFEDAHIFCLPTRKDVYGLVFIEAMASGCAIIADDSPVREEILDEGRAGLLADPYDPEDIADRLVTLLHSPLQAKSLAKRALERFKSHYYWKPVGKKYVTLLRQAASGQ
jgi:glycosyltransferase involved in cell wall biosynthesis